MKAKEIKIIYSSFDTQLNGNDLKIYNKLMHSSYEAKDEFRKLNFLRRLIYENSNQTFRDDFSHRVMSRICQKLVTQADQIVNYTLSIIFKQSSLVGLSLILLLVIFNIIMTGDFSFYGIFGIKKQSLDLLLNLF